MAFVRFRDGDTLVTDDSIRVANMKYMSGVPLDTLAANLGKSTRTMRRHFNELDGDHRPRGPQHG
jgi:AraC-like DNA-binding protein